MRSPSYHKPPTPTTAITIANPSPARQATGAFFVATNSQRQTYWPHHR